MKPFIPLFAGLAGWFVIATMVLTTFVSSGPLVPVETPPEPTPAPLEAPSEPAKPAPEVEPVVTI